jgi:hypothetical protein
MDVAPDESLSDAEARYLAEIWSDCQEILGPALELLDLDRGVAEGATRLTARFRFAGRVRESMAAGETVVAAHAALRERLVYERVRLTFEAVAWR